MACPMCEKDPIPAYRPFCSKRCADLDLGRWLNEDYKIATEDSEATSAAEAPTDVAHRLN